MCADGMFSAMSDSLLDFGAKVRKKTIGCSTCRQLVMEMSVTLLHFSVYQCITKPNFGALNMMIVVYC